MNLYSSASDSDGFVPYPGYTYYLDDLWYYNLSDHTWTNVDTRHGSKNNFAIPAARTGHVMLLVNKG